MALTKRTYQINTNRGVDLSSSPLNVAPSRASYMRNMINDGGINKKRHGWNEIACFKDKNGNELAINGIWEYVNPADSTERHLIVYAGTQFFKCDYDFLVQEKITVESDANVNGEKSKAYYKDGLLWIIGCGDYLVYDGEKISRVENSKYAYAPVTTMNITPNYVRENDDTHTFESPSGEAFEDVNLLTRKRKNKLIGKKGAYKSVSYILDSKFDYSMPIKITIDVIPAGIPRNENEIAVYARYADGSEVTDIVTLTYQTSNYNESGQLTYYTAACNGKEVTLYTKDENGAENPFSAIVRLFNRESGTINFYFSVSTYIDGYSNITVEYYADYKRSIDLIASAVYTQANGVDLLLVANRGNAIFYNGLDSADCEHSFGYIPVEKFITFGTDREPITAIVPMTDGVGVFKGKSFYRVAFTFTSDSETYTAEYVPQITEAADGFGCVNQFVGCNVNGDTLIFDGKGVYGIEYSSSQRSLKLRSSNISKAFEKYSRAQLESAVACEHDGRYYLFISGDVYIGDSRFKVYESNRIDTSFEYEWWVWDNCPVSFVCSIDGKLYLGRENGRIAVFDGEFTDRSNNYLKYSMGDFLYFIQPRGRTEFVFNENLKITEGKRLFLKNAYSLIGEFNSVLENGMVKLRIDDLELLDLGLIYEGVQIYFEIDMRGPYDITDITAENGVWYAYVNAPSCYEFETVITNVENKPYIVTENDGRYSLLEESFANTSYKKEQCYLCAANSWDMELVIKNEQNVECEYHTPVMDLGSHLSLKILNQLAITVSNETEGQVEIGYQTNNNNTFMKRNIGSAFDFNNFDFNTFAFDGAFYKTHIKRVFERNFNYILFKFASKSDSDFAVEAFTCVYSSNNKLLKGDR